nr:crotonase/enoyl-CoA hydratase family protein [Kibdelosporangium sp. MJ126-NF4]CEL21812.1 Enoyl-CoA hydratase [Kibdelosporangium sp. MJ126-NF4]CTQ92592.1 Enoyl-CoA hydratase (EC 4.2.1.17) [Kibdelosporangium sp. MJ126-NF4]
MTVTTATEGKIRLITLRRPEVRNAMNRAMADALDAALREFDTDPALVVAVLTGASGTFCSGMDLKAFATEGIPTVADRGLGGLTRAHLTKPVIAAVEGHAVAGGCELALACDLIVAARDANFGLPEVRRGLVAGEGGALRLPRRLPHHIAMEHLLTGDPLPATDAAHHGLVNRLTDNGQALPVALHLAQRIAENAPLALTATKAIAHTSTFAEQDPHYHHVSASRDAKEGSTAFTEKRPPVWLGA